MKVTTFQGETSLDALTTRLYGDAAKDHPQLRARLLNENPQLGDLTKVAPGTPIAVPENGVSAPDPIDPANAAAVQMAGAVIDALQARRLEVLARREQTLSQFQTLVADPSVLNSVKNAVKNADPRPVDTLTSIGAAAATARQEVDAQKNELATSIALARRFISGGPRGRAVRSG